MNTLKQLVLQEADTQKILLKIQTFMKCALEVRAGAWQSRELPYFPALLHVFPGVGEPPRARLYLYCSGDGFALVELCVWAALRDRYQSQAEERVTTRITTAVCEMTKVTLQCVPGTSLSRPDAISIPITSQFFHKRQV